MSRISAYKKEPEQEVVIEGLLREDLIQKYMRKVKLIARMVSSKVGARVEFEDLLHAGVVGLLDAIEKYDSTRTNRFSTYAEFRIRGAILDSLRGNDFLSRSSREKANKLNKALDKLQCSLNREPTQEEVAQELGLDLEQYFRLLDDVKSITLFSIDETYDDDGSRSLGDTIAKPGETSAFEMLADASMRNAMKEAIKQLKPRQREIILLYYFQGLNLKEVGQTLSLSESRVCQLHSEAIARLRLRAKRMLEV